MTALLFIPMRGCEVDLAANTTNDIYVIYPHEGL